MYAPSANDKAAFFETYGPTLALFRMTLTRPSTRAMWHAISCVASVLQSSMMISSSSVQLCFKIDPAESASVF